MKIEKISCFSEKQEMCLICNGENLEGKTEINISFCYRLTSLPPLPAGLQRLYCYNCAFLTSLTSSPEISLPEGLRVLDCSSCCRLTSLPRHLPTDLQRLSCSLCPLTSLPPLPIGLVLLACSFCPLSSLPPLPVELRSLYCSSSPFLISLPPLPEGLQHLYCCKCSWLDHPQNPEFQHNIRLLRILQNKLKTKLWKRRLIKQHYLKIFPREISNLILSF